VMIGKNQAIVSSSDRRPSALNDLITRVMDMVRAVPEDPYCGLADPACLFKGPLPDLELYDSSHISAEQLAEMASKMEDAMYTVKGVTNSAGAGASSGSWSMAMVTSDAFSGSYKGSSFSASISAIAGEGGGMERDYDFTSARYFADLDDMATIGKKAGNNVVKRLNPQRIESGEMSVVFDPRVANSLLGHFAGAINGTSIARGTSFLKDAMNRQVFPSDINIIDDPLIVRGHKSRPFDGEGVKTTRQSLIENGMLQQWALNSAAARQLGLTTTGHASRGTSSPPGIGMSNLYMAAGSKSPEELMADIENGIYISELIGMGVNGVTGDYSRGAAGFIIKNGQISAPVNEITIASNLKDMFKRMIVADDLVFKYGTNAPTVRIDGMMVASA
jgi:PmbA protein